MRTSDRTPLAENLDSQGGRYAVGRDILAWTVVLLVCWRPLLPACRGIADHRLIVVRQSSLPAAQHPSTQISLGGLNITNMVVVVLSGGFQRLPATPQRSTPTRPPTRRAPTTFTVDVNIEYNNCHDSSCPAEITSVFVAPASFTVQSNPP